VGLASVLDHALTEMRAKLEAHQVSVSRTISEGDGPRRRRQAAQVFTNVDRHAIDAMESNTGSGAWNSES